MDDHTPISIFLFLSHSQLFGDKRWDALLVLHTCVTEREEFETETYAKIVERITAFILGNLLQPVNMYIVKAAVWS